MNYLLDTNVISENFKPQPNPEVIAWIQANAWAEAFVSVMTLGEIAAGIERAKNPQHKARLERWFFDLVLPHFKGRTLEVDWPIAREWGRLRGQFLNAGRPLPPVDTLLAATAIVHDLTLVTRNTADLEPLPVKLHNPWE